MRFRSFSWRGVVVAALALGATGLPGSLGCSGEPFPPEATLLRTRFPGHAAEILEAGHAFVAAPGGFVLPHEAPSSHLVAGLPADGAGVVRLRAGRPGSETVEVRVRAIGASGRGAVASGAVSYRRAGGTSFWTATPSGLEEWLHLDAGVVRPDRPAAAWEVEGATLKEAEGGVEVATAVPTARLRVTAPRAFAEGGRPIQARLAVKDGRLELFVDAAGEAVLVDPLWVQAGTMSTARYGHRGNWLSSQGKVLVTGGVNGPVFASTELYTVATDSWAPGPSMSSARYRHEATTLGNGRVLVSGGANGGSYNQNSQLYDPASNSWAPEVPMVTSRSYHTATWIPSIQGVLVTGGRRNNPGPVESSCEIYSVASNSWSPAASMGAVRMFHAAALLADGRVLVTGGVGPDFVTAVASVEIYNPSTDQWSPGATMASAHDRHSMVVLPNDRVHIVGGFLGGTPTASAELYDPAADSWSPAAPLAQARYAFASVLLANGKHLVAGGGPSAIANAELYDSVANAWSPAGGLVIGRFDNPGNDIGNGRVLLAGGFDAGGGPTATTEIYGPAANGAPCLVPGECASGHCVDNFCCNTACTGTCRACSTAKSGSGPNGQCSNVDAGGDPDNECPTEAASTCGGTGSCNGSGACALYPNGTLCAPPTCAGATTAQQASTCNGSGTCVPGGAQDCGLFLCAGGTCPATCAGDASCVATAYCGPGGVCLAKKAAGATCGAANECSSTFCVDFLCCNTACIGACRACSAAKKGSGADGTCGDVAVDTDPNNDCAAEATSTCGTTGSCNGSGACALYPTATLCAPGACFDATTAILASSCDGTGTCVPGAQQSCGPTPCVSGVCASACTGDAECGPTAYCKMNVCTAKATEGTVCTADKQCLSDFCVDGVCCSSACDGGPCDACSVSAGGAVDGACTPFSGAPCDDGDDCTQTDTCEVGACIGSNPVSCTALDVCHLAGTCDPASGECSDPIKPLDCPPPGACENEGICDPGTGDCVNTAKPDGSLCSQGGDSGTCFAGACLVDGSPGSAGSGVTTGGSASGGGSVSGSGSTGSANGGGGQGPSGGSGASGAESTGSGLTLLGGGCAANGSRAGGWGAWLLFGLLLLARRRSSTDPGG